MLKTIIMGQLRHLAGAFGSMLVASGWINQADANMVAGALMVAAAMAWSAMEKVRSK